MNTRTSISERRFTRCTQPLTWALWVTGMVAKGALAQGQMPAQQAMQQPVPQTVSQPMAPPSSGTTPASPKPVIVSGTVPDEATRAAVVGRLREIYGADRVVDQLALGPVVAPPQWGQYVGKLLSPNLKQVNHGQLSVQGQTVQLQGEVANEAQRQQLAAEMAQSLNPTYNVRNGLRVAAREQGLVDQVLANRTIEFEPGSAVLKPAGQLILDEMAAALLQLRGRRVALIGHTDALGARPANVSLSLARAQAVKTYLVGKGVPADSLSTSGLGPDQPVADNATEAGRARNRRIEFRVGT